MFKLLKNQWKESLRSPIFQKNVAVNIFLGFIILYFLFMFGLLGFLIDKVLDMAFPTEDPIDVFNGAIFGYLLFDLVIRFFMQDLPTLSIQPYLHLPFSKKKLVHYMLIRSGLHLFNFFPLLVFVPAAFKLIHPDYGTGPSYTWLSAIFLLMLANNYIVVYFKRQLANNMKYVIGFGVAVIGTMVLDYFDIIKLSVLSTATFNYVIENSWTVGAAAALFVGMYLLNYRFLSQNMYMEAISTKKAQEADRFTNMTALDRFGTIGKLVTLDIKLIFRHKRTRTIVFLTPILLAYGLIFYLSDQYQGSVISYFFGGVFVTGMFLMNYGQYLYSWESEHFDAILAHNIDTKQYIKAKFALMVPVAVICFLISLLYGFLDPIAIPVNTAAVLFNVGINSFALMYFSTNNSKRLELSKGGTFNAQGISMNQFVMTLPMLGLPALIFWLVQLVGDTYIALAVVGGLGLVSLLLYDFWFNLITKAFKQKKYKMAAGFRKQD